MKIDAHNHIGKKKGISVSVDDFIKNMDEAGIDKAVVFSFSEQIDNEYVIESVNDIPIDFLALLQLILGLRHRKRN